MNEWPRYVFSVNFRGVVGYIYTVFFADQSTKLVIPALASERKSVIYVHDNHHIDDEIFDQPQCTRMGNRRFETKTFYAMHQVLVLRMYVTPVSDCKDRLRASFTAFPESTPHNQREGEAKQDRSVSTKQTPAQRQNGTQVPTQLTHSNVSQEPNSCYRRKGGQHFQKNRHLSRVKPFRPDDVGPLLRCYISSTGSKVGDRHNKSDHFLDLRSFPDMAVLWAIVCLGIRLGRLQIACRPQWKVERNIGNGHLCGGSRYIHCHPS